MGFGAPGVATPVAANLGGTGIANNALSTLTITGNFGLAFTVAAATALTLPTAGTLLASGSGANVVITQNSVAAISFLEANATANTIHTNSGFVGINRTAAGGTARLAVNGGAVTALRLEVNGSENLLEAGGNGSVSIDASGIAGGRWVMLNGGEIGYGLTTPTTSVRLTAQGLAAASNDIQRWTAYTGTGTAGATLAFVSGAGTITALTTTVGGLPAAAAGYLGARAFVTDALTTVILGLGTTVAAGGANKVPVYCDGANWIYG